MSNRARVLVILTAVALMAAAVINAYAFVDTGGPSNLATVVFDLAVLAFIILVVRKIGQST